jgi:hypothetical protein
LGKKRTDEVRKKISEALKGHGGYTDEIRQVMSDKAREHAALNFSGGQAAIAFAEVLCPAGYIREHYLYYGDPVQPFFRDLLRRHFFRLDFAHLEAKVNIELDGTRHSSALEIEIDKARDEIIRGLGWCVIRIKL